MILEHLSVFNYKNIRQAQLDFSPKINCFIGNNGEGKTNLLDAIYYLSFCHSCFSHVDAYNITHGEEYFSIDGRYRTEAGEEEQVQVAMKRGKHKHFRRNKKEYKRYSEHIGLIPLLFVSPSDNILVEGGGEERRRLMDVVISQLDHQYLEALMRYNKALQQRNALLKSDQEPDGSLLDILEEQMAVEGEAVFNRRVQFVEEIIPEFQRVYTHISGGKEEVQMRYVSHCQRGALIDVIRRDRHRDRAIGYSLHGVHRDDLEMLLGEQPIRREGSQGQTKTFVLALKLAQFGLLRRTATATTPLLLLDDIFDKLDAKRVEQIISLVSVEEYGQIFITDTNRDHLDRILAHTNHHYALFDVSQGDVMLRREEREGGQNV